LTLLRRDKLDVEVTELGSIAMMLLPSVAVDEPLCGVAI
jgi:hypothetical protein